MTEFTMRAPLPAEAARLARLGRDIFVETFDHLYSRDDLNMFLATTYGTDIQAAQIADPDMGLQIAEAGGEWIGYARVAPLGLPFAIEGRRAGELKQLYVFKAWHGRGVAERLMGWSMAELRRRGYADVCLSVFSDNPRAQRFYQRYGFEKIADYIFMVGNQADKEFVFRATLT